MITTLEKRKIKLLGQIEKLKREINRLKCLEYKGLVLYPDSDTSQEKSS